MLCVSEEIVLLGEGRVVAFGLKTAKVTRGCFLVLLLLARCFDAH